LQADLPLDVNTSRVLYRFGLWNRNSRFEPIKRTRWDSATAARDQQWKQLVSDGAVDALGFSDLYAVHQISQVVARLFCPSSDAQGVPDIESTTATAGDGQLVPLCSECPLRSCCQYAREAGAQQPRSTSLGLQDTLPGLRVPSAHLAQILPECSAWADLTCYFFVCNEAALHDRPGSSNVFVPRGVLGDYWPLHGTHMLSREIFWIGSSPVSAVAYDQLGALPDTEPVEVAFVSHFTAQGTTACFSSTGIQKMLGASGYICRFQATLSDAGVVQLTNVARDM
jgi:hypothetical protein